MDRIRPDILEIYEHLGRYGKFPSYLTDEEILSIKSSKLFDSLWHLGQNTKILENRVKLAYLNLDNFELIKVTYILMGYHILEKLLNGYGSLSSLYRGYAVDIGLDPQICNFFSNWIRFNGGNNYYFDSIEPSQDNLKVISKQFEEIKERNLEKYLIDLKREKEFKKQEEARISKKRQEELMRYQEWLESQPWYSFGIEIDKLERDITFLKNQLKEKESKLRYNKFQYTNLKIIPELLKKNSKEILLYIISSKNHIDFYVQLLEKILMEDIKKLDNEKFNIFLDKLKVSGKKSKFRKLYKELTKTSS